jgi:hypothetical protein
VLCNGAGSPMESDAAECMDLFLCFWCHLCLPGQISRSRMNRLSGLVCRRCMSMDSRIRS